MSDLAVVVPEFRPTLRATSRGKIIGTSPSIPHVLQTIDRVAGSSCTVLVTGESGTGKELVVAALHDASPRRSAPIVTLNCGAIPENLVESELFGHARGAFTGAVTARHGHVAAAEGGTLFLDEVGELPLAMQVKLLRLLQQREYTPVGESRVVKCDIRVVAATNKDLEKEVAAGRFREDLLYRLNVIHIHLPALRDRGTDVVALAHHFLKISCERASRPDILGFAEETVEFIATHTWPGNVRALENAIERSVLMSVGGKVTVRDLGLKSVSTSNMRKVQATVSTTSLPAAGIDLRFALERYENNLIKQALERTNGNKNRAAQLLGLNRTTLVEMIRRKGNTPAGPGLEQAGRYTMVDSDQVAVEASGRSRR